MPTSTSTNINVKSIRSKYVPGSTIIIYNVPYSAELTVPEIMAKITM